MARDVAASPPQHHVMMSAHSTPNLQPHQPQQQHHQQAGSKAPPAPATAASIYSYLHNQSGLNFAPVVQPPHWEQQQEQHHQHHQQHHHRQQEQQWARHDAGSPPPAPPVRDASSLKGVKYGPGHEKFPSWPMSPATEPTPTVRAAPGGGSHRSKSWTDHTNYPKENGIPYQRPYMKRPNPAFAQQQLKTVMERCEKMSSESDAQGRLYLPRVDREGKLLGDLDYMVPSPPERDVISTKPHLTQADLEEYAKSLSTSYRDPHLTKVELEEYALSYQEPKPSPHLTQADLEEYSRTYDETLRPQHQHQPSYAQSEGYHSYVSSTDSALATPFMDRLRRDSEAGRAVPGPQTAWPDEVDRAGRDSVVTTSSGSASSSETLKWHGSTSDVSVSSSSYAHHQGSSSRQLIAHSAKVQSPQRHNSESVLFPAGGSGWQTRVQRNNNHNKLRLFPVNTYTVQPEQSRVLPVSPTSPQLSVAERISELERQQSKYSYLDPDKRHRVPDPTLKAIQKKALLSFYERHHSTPSPARSQAWRSEPLLAQPATMTLAPCPQSPPPQPPPRPRGNPTSRRASSASDYAGNWREKTAVRQEKIKEPGNIKDGPRHQHSNSCGSLSTDLLGPLIMGPTILLDDWVPERPPKKAHLRVAFPPPSDRLPSPDLPPPSPPPVLEDEVFAFDEPLPPPPPELHSEWNQSCEKVKTSQMDVRQRQENGTGSKRSGENGFDYGVGNHRHADVGVERKSPTSPAKTPTSPNKSPLSPNNRNMNQTFARTLSMKRSENDSQHNCGVPAMKLNENKWPALRYQTQKLMVNGKVATSLPVQEAERIDHQNGNILLPSKARLQRIPSDRRNGSSPPSRSPPQLKPSHANDSRLRTVNIRDSFRSQKSRNCLPMSPPGEKVPQERKVTPPCERMQPDRRLSPPGERVPQERKVTPPCERMQPDRRLSPPGDRMLQDRQLSPPVDRVRLSPPGERISPPVTLRLDPESNARKDPSPTSPSDSGRGLQGNNSILSTSKASYLAYMRDSHREQSLPNFEGSYKRTMPPSEAALDSQPRQIDCDRLPTVAPVNLPVASEKLSPSHHVHHPVLFREQSIIIPTVIDEKPSVKMISDNLKLQRLTPPDDIMKQFIENEPVPSNNEQSNTNCDEVGEISVGCVHSATHGIEIQTQCDMEKLDIQCVNVNRSESIESRGSSTETLPMVDALDDVSFVSSTTSDASSQTERETLESDVPSTAVASTLVRQKLQEEIDCEKLSLDLASQLSPNDKLQGILVSGVEYKKSTDYVAGLFRLDVAHRPRNNSVSMKCQSPAAVEVSVATTNRDVLVKPSDDGSGPLSPSSVYFTTSESKAKFLTRFGSDINQPELMLRDNKELHKKKEELMSRLDRKLVVLRAEHLELTEESRINDELGESVASQVACLARPHEAAKYRLHVEEVGKITSLLLGLSGRLARVENALVGMPELHSERKILESKRDKLQDQLEEAKKLKENIDRRSVFVSNILCKYFNAEEYTDYDHFINMKAKLIMDSREIIDKIKLGEEQLVALKETLSS